MDLTPEVSPPFCQLPDEIAGLIASRLCLLDVLSLNRTCTFWRAACEADDLWRYLHSQRSPLQTRASGLKIKSSESLDEETDKGWKQQYVARSLRVAAEERDIIDLLDNFPTFEGKLTGSIEISPYQNALRILKRGQWSKEDVVEKLFSAEKSVFFNLVGLHHCLQLAHPDVDLLQRHLEQRKIADRTICIRVWSMGGWAVQGFRRRDEFLVIPDISLATILASHTSEKANPNSSEQSLGELALKILQRGLMHEVRRVQLSADFQSSAWVSREQHSQR